MISNLLIYTFETPMTTGTPTTFAEFELNQPVMKALDEVGYETPTPIQAQTIPLMLQGQDVIGQAQTGTGKTAAFALPILTRLDLKQKQPQVLVLAPTRELAIQVAEAFKTYASKLKGFQVIPIYGGMDYRAQLRALQRGVHVVVGTPGRVMDHMRRGTLMLDQLSTLVLDEADEMLRMGFIDDVEWILEKTPPKRQIALFSATMPHQIRRIATQHLNEPAQITIKQKTTTAETIRQRFWPVSGMHKLDALTRILEAESFDAMLIFVRTKTSTGELAEKLQARGYAAVAINGDIAQQQRERTIQNLKNGKLDILVATDVAARGLDVDRISHVVNYDIPHDIESYVHRIGRTGRAGKSGDAILFVAPRERRLLHSIEKATRQKIEIMDLPSTELINDKRIEKFKQRITDALAVEEIGLFYQLIEQYQQEHNVPALEIAAALAQMLQGDEPFMLKHKPQPKAQNSWKDDTSARDKKPTRNSSPRPPRKETPPEVGMERYRIEVGHNHQVQPGNIVGAIANEAGLESQHIGYINIFDDHSLVDLPEDMPRSVFNDLKKTWVLGQQLNISNVSREANPKGAPARKKPKVKDKTAKKSRPKIKATADKTTPDAVKAKTRSKKKVKKSNSD
jgi:ATP-dependent RNA helicase DeaD